MSVLQAIVLGVVQGLGEFLPIGLRFAPLIEITRFYAGREMDFEINLIIKALEVPPLRLSAASGPRLGWTSWIKTADFANDDSQVVLNPVTYE